MMAVRRSALGLSLAVAIAGGSLVPAIGTAASDTAAIAAQKKSRVRKKAVAGWVHHWNQIAIDASGLDHTPVAAGETRVFGEQLGPGAREPGDGDRPHRDLRRRERDRPAATQSYTGLPARRGRRPRWRPRSPRRRTTRWSRSSPRRRRRFDALLAEDLGQIPDGSRKDATASRSGSAAAAAILALRRRRRLAARRAAHRHRLHHRATSRASGGRTRSARPARARRLLGRGEAVRPAVGATSSASPPPPALDSPEYAAAFDEVKRLGGDGIVTPTERTRRADARSASTGPTTARRACARRRGSTTRSRCTSPTRWAPTPSSWRGSWRW